MSRAAAIVLLAGACAAGAVTATVPGHGRDAHAQTPLGPVQIEPQLGPGLGATLLGSAPQGASGDPAEAWAYRLAGSSLSPPVGGGGSMLAYGQGEEQVLLLRYTRADGWRHVETPLTQGGDPYSGGTPGGGRVTPRGGLVLATNDTSLPGSASRRLLVADRGARPQAVAAPGSSVLQDASASLPAESLSLTVLAAADEGEHTVAYTAIEGRTAQTGVARWDGTTWSREPICLADDHGTAPAGCAPAETLTGSSLSFQAVAIAAAGTHAWLLARAAPATGRGLVLFERASGPGGPRWRLHPLGLPLFEQAETPARGVRVVAPLASPNALTATENGVWVDGGFQLNGVPTSVTAYVDGAGATSWCDGEGGGAPLCDHPLGARFGRFHRSFAWPGPGPGTRVITDAKRPGEEPESTAPEEYLTLEGTSFVRHPSYNGSLGHGAAFGAPDEGWVGWSHLTRAGTGRSLAQWPLPARRPLTAIVGQPGQSPGGIGAGALAVGEDGTVLRYTPGQGWDSEPLLGSSGVARPRLRGVAWPTPEFAYAVGDEGAMWRWRSATGLWESDPGAPFDFQGHLMGIAFQPGNPERGYAVGRQGVLLRYGKSWTQEGLPPEVQHVGPLGGPADLTAVAFAGSQALVAAWEHLLVNDGGDWHVDAGAQALIDKVTDARVYAVAGLPDGGAVAAGRGIVLIRDAAGAPWRLADQPLPDQIVTAAGAFREGDRVRALVSVTPGVASSWPAQEEVDLPPTEPGAPPARPPAFSPPTFGTLLRETTAGWRDEEGTLFRTRSADHARKSDPVAALLVDGAGRGWVAGGWSGAQDVLANGGESGKAQPVATASLARYSPAGPEPPPAQRAAPVATPAGRARLLVGGHSRCEEPCAGLGQLELAPDRTLAHAAAQAATLAAQPGGPAALLYTSGGSPQQGEADRLAQLLRPATAALPVYAAVPTAGGASAPFTGFSAPFGNGGGPPLTHYAADLQTSAGTIRVVVIDNSAGSLAAGDPQQNPLEPQQPWLVSELRGAKAAGVPVVVMGARSLNRFEPDATQVAADADSVAALLRDEGASAYVYDSPESQRAATIPAGDPQGIPTYGSGTLGYRQPADSGLGFGIPGLLLLELDLKARDKATNRAPASVRLIPVIEDLALEAVDGRVLNRSQPALFRGLGRRPRAGDRWRNEAGGSDPYVQLPNPSCALQGCAGRIDPEARFTSSDPDIAGFVRQDPASDNPRKPFVDKKTDKPVADASSGLLCAFNAGTTTVSVEAGGLAYSTTVTVRGGSVLRPCGTVPLSPKQFRPGAEPGGVGSPPPPPQQQPGPVTPELVLPPPVLPLLPLAQPAARPLSPPPFTPPYSSPPAAIFPRPITSARPLPPSGTSPVSSTTSVMQPATKVEEQKKEEEALEHQQSASRYMPGERRLVGGLVLGLVLSAALGATALRPRSRPGGDRGRQLARSYTTTTPQRHWRPR